MSGEMKRMLTSKNFLAAWLIACAALLFGQTYPSLKKPLTCGAFIDLLDSAIKGQIVSFIIVLPSGENKRFPCSAQHLTANPKNRRREFLRRFLL